MQRILISLMFAVAFAVPAVAQDASARTVAYHSQDIVPIHAKLKYTTLIQVPWYGEDHGSRDRRQGLLGRRCREQLLLRSSCEGRHQHQSEPHHRQGQHLQLYAAGRIDDVSAARSQGADSARRSVLDRRGSGTATVRTRRSAGAVEAAARERCSRMLDKRWTSTRATTRPSSSSTTASRQNEAPFDIQSIYHDDKFTYIKTNAPEKFSVYEMKDGKPNLISYELRGWHLHHSEGDGHRVFELGKKRMDFSRKA